MTSDDYMSLFYVVIPIFVATVIEGFGFRKKEGAWWFCSIVECVCISIVATGLNFFWPISIWFYAFISFVISFACMWVVFRWNTIKEKEKDLKEREEALAVCGKNPERNDMVEIPENYFSAITSVSMTPTEYKKLILEAEKNAKNILLLPKRLTVMFKSDEMIRDMAKKRYGDGSPYVQAYVSEHIERKAAFYSKLDNGCQVYEIHNRAELVRYLTKQQKHVGIKQISNNHVVEMLELWKDAIIQYQNGYYVAFTDEPLPLKYELIDDTKFIIHESAGTNSLARLNAIFVDSPEFGKKVHDDFFSIWERTDPKYKNREYIVRWIDYMIQEITSSSQKVV